MTITAVRSVNKNLPHADIYLNDVWEIEKLFTDSYSKLDTEVSVTFSYIIDNLEITTREELQAHGGKVTNFTLQVTESKLGFLTSDRVLSFRGLINPQIDVPHRLRDLRWELHGRVNSIFYDRRKRYKDFVSQVPTWVFLSIFFTYLLLLDVLHLAFKNYLVISGVFIGLYSIACYAIFSKNWVYLQNSRDDERARTDRWKERFEKMVWLLAGAFFGVIGTLVTNHFKH